MTAGRPTKYDPRYCEDIIDHMSMGGSIEGFGAYIGDKYKDRSLAVSKMTIFEWFKVHPEFLEAKEIGLSYSRKFYDDMGNSGMAGQLKRIVKEIYHPESGRKEVKYAAAYFNDKAWAMNMKNRFGWKDRTELEHSNPDGSMKPQVIITMPDNGKSIKNE